jgi:peroxiredoxin
LEFFVVGVLLVVVTVVAAGYWYYRTVKAKRAVPQQLERGRPLPQFTAVDEQGRAVDSGDLRGHVAVLLFVRGTWCPFCSSQVENLAGYYKEINSLGARLILVTPKPLETTRRVARFFDVDFDFWLDESLSVARDLGLLLEQGVPEDYRREYGTDTVWPTALVVDAAGIIRYVRLSKTLADRPDPKEILNAVRNVTGNPD